jgi:nucleotide-binding universal stress UspA family protein
MSGILVALDDSVGSERALEAAVKLAQQDGGAVSAVSVLDRSGDPHLAQLTDGVKAQARSHLEDLLKAAGNFARSRGVHLNPILCEGHPANTIIDCADQQHARLVVLGANSDGKAGDGLGDTADLVSNHCPCTVLIVKS